MNHSLLLQALGWALFNSLWQFGLLWFLFFLTTRLSPVSSPFKHSLALAASITGTIWFLITLVTGYQQSLLLLSFQPGDSGAFYMLSIIPQPVLERSVSYGTIVYLLIVALQFSRFLYSFYRSHRLYSTGLSKAAVDIRLYVQKTALQLRIKRRVQVFISAYVDTPLVIGFLKPTILMPLACVNQLSIPQLEAILLHELAHIKRNDYLVNMWVAFLEILFFFNPFARMILLGIKREREYTCDDWVMQYQFNAHQYASALLTLEKSRVGYLQSGVAATGASRKILLHRVQRILQAPGQKEPFPLSGMAACMAVCAFFGFLSQQPARSGEKPETNLRASSLHTFHFPARKQVFTTYTLPVPAGRRNPVLSPVTEKKPAVKPVQPVPESVPEEDLLIPVSVTEQPSPLTEPLDALDIETRNFSIPDLAAPELPAAAQISGLPYVPSASFYFSTDTVKPTRPATYREQAARESLLKTRRALNEVDWTAIQKRLSSKVSVQMLKKELERSIARLNWQQINEEIRDSLVEQSRSNNKITLHNEMAEMNRWKAQQQQLESLQNKLRIQQKNYKLDTEKKSLELQKQLAQAKIIIYL